MLIIFLLPFLSTVIVINGFNSHGKSLCICHLYYSEDLSFLWFFLSYLESFHVYLLLILPLFYCSKLIYKWLWEEYFYSPERNLLHGRKKCRGFVSDGRKRCCLFVFNLKEPWKDFFVFLFYTFQRNKEELPKGSFSLRVKDFFHFNNFGNRAIWAFSG